MITAKTLAEARKQTVAALKQANIAITPEEAANIEVADFGLSDLQNIGLQIIVYINTHRVCAKELVLTPWQTCPEHRHPTVNGTPGKEETFRCRTGLVYLYIAGEPNSNPQLHGLDEYGEYLTATHEIVLHPGQQYTLPPDTLHWFRAGADGAVVSEFSTSSTDENDIFTDPRVQRATRIG